MHVQVVDGLRAVLAIVDDDAVAMREVELCRHLARHNEQVAQQLPCVTQWGMWQEGRGSE